MRNKAIPAANRAKHSFEHSHPHLEHFKPFFPSVLAAIWRNRCGPISPVPYCLKDRQYRTISHSQARSLSSSIARSWPCYMMTALSLLDIHLPASATSAPNRPRIKPGPQRHHTQMDIAGDTIERLYTWTYIPTSSMHGSTH